MNYCRDCKHWKRNSGSRCIRIQVHPVGLRVRVRVKEGWEDPFALATLFSESCLEDVPGAGRQFFADLEIHGKRSRRMFYTGDIDWESFWGLPEATGVPREGDCQACGSAEYARGSEMFYTNNGYNEGATLTTREDFGCVQWEAK